jgi:hypothetical protein
VTVIQQPLFSSKRSDFDLRLNFGKHLMLIYAKSSIVWEEPDLFEDEGYFPAHDEIRTPVSLGYKVEHLI